MDEVSKNRRSFLSWTTLAASGVAANALWTKLGYAGDRVLTAEMTTGPFYPIPKIAEQKHYDVDLTCNGEKDAVAEGEIIVVKGIVVDLDGQPLSKTVVEVWQANAAGRYNHERDDNSAPLDPNFQYWARFESDDEGRFSFKTILPGEYPGRTPHIHFLVESPKTDQRKAQSLISQLFFDDSMDANKRDGIYRGLTKSQQKALTIELNADSENDNLPTGQFEIVLDARDNPKKTPGL